MIARKFELSGNGKLAIAHCEIGCTELIDESRYTLYLEPNVGRWAMYLTFDLIML